MPACYKTFEPRLNPQDDWKDTYTEHLISEVAIQANQSAQNTEKGLSAKVINTSFSDRDP